MLHHRIASRLAVVSILGVTALMPWPGGRLAAQTAGSRAPAAPATPKASALIDLTGYWVSVVTEDWRWRMVTPARGDYASIPLTLAGKKAADTWDPARDEAAGEQCRSYGAPALMRVPTRLHVTWQDDQTLKVDTDEGTQTRLLHFGEWRAPAGKPTWQGDSVAEWDGRHRSQAVGTFGDGGMPPPPGHGSLKVVTTHVRPGYLRKNGVPYSANAELTEYWDLSKERNGDQWIVITTVVHDPVNLQIDWITSPNFKKEPDGSKWDPTPCSARW